MLKEIDLTLFHDDRGDLGVLEISDFVNWDVKRIYYVTNVVKPRGGHCVTGEKKIYVCLKGRVLARFYDGNDWKEISLVGPNQAVLMEGDYWREFVDFTEDCVLLAVSSMNYESDKYIMNLTDYEKYVKSHS